MPTTLVLPDGYSHVLASTLAASSVTVLHSIMTARLRRAAGITYPNAYATAAEAATDPAKYRFNCAQRAHANYSENHPSMVLATLLAGLRYPQAASTLALLWTLGRFIFLLGYTKKGSAEDRGSGRLWGAWNPLVQWGALGLAGWTTWGMMQ